jgi:hypothetical protein
MAGNAQAKTKMVDLRRGEVMFPEYEPAGTAGSTGPE